MSNRLTDLLLKLKELEKAKKLTPDEDAFIQDAIIAYNINQGNDMRMELIKKEVQSVTNINDILNNTIMSITSPQPQHRVAPQASQQQQEK